MMLLEYLDTIDKTSDMDYEEVPEEFKNTLLLYQLEKDPNKTLQYICDRVVSDVYPMNGGYYLHIKDRTEPLSYLKLTIEKQVPMMWQNQYWVKTIGNLFGIQPMMFMVM